MTVKSELGDLNAADQYPGESLSAYTIRVLRDAILSGQLAPGSRIKQNELAEQLGLSRIPVRDGLRRLESEGLVVLPPNRPARVAKIDLAELEDIYELRIRVEPYAMRLAARNGSARQLREIEALAHAFDTRTGDDEDMLGIDREFHSTTIAAAGRSRLVRMATDLLNSSQHYRRAYARLESGRAVICAEHHLLVDALRARDEDAAAAVCERHLSRTTTLLREHLRSDS